MLAREFGILLLPKMIPAIRYSRCILLSPSICTRTVSQLVSPGYVVKNATNQLEYIKSEAEKNAWDWSNIKSQALNIPGTLNDKNFEGVVLKNLINSKKFNIALSLAKYIKSSGDLNLGATNGLLQLYYELGSQQSLNDEDKEFILQAYKDIYNKYKVLDSITCERLLHALCVINDWKKAMKVLEDIHLSSKPTHSAYSTLISTFFKLNKKVDAMKMIERSLNDRRPLQPIAYQEWIDYILRKYKDKKTISKYLDEVCMHISSNYVVVAEATAVKLLEVYNSLGWRAEFTKIKKRNGECTTCHESLACLSLSDEEFTLLQKNIKDKLIVGSDLFLKTSPAELEKFLKFVENTTPYDIVLDALNIAFAVGKGGKMDKSRILENVVEHYRRQNKRMLLLGRKHMYGWPKMNFVLSKTCHFFTDNITQDDPYFITAAILSGPQTDIVSKDLLRGHKFILQDKNLQSLFQRWQWQHQWKVHVNRRQTVIQEPLAITPCAQKKGPVWHLPYEKDSPSESTFGHVKDGVPDWGSWLCITPAR